MPHAIDDEDWPKFKRLMRDYTSGRFRQKPPKDDRPKGGRGGKPATALLVRDLRHTATAWAAKLRPGKRAAYFVTLLGDPTGGQFTLRVGGPTGTVTEPIAYDADADALKAALSAADVKPAAVHFGGAATYTLGGTRTDVTPRRWLVEYAGEAPALTVQADEVEGESLVVIQETPLNLQGSRPAFLTLRLDLPHDPAYRPVRAGAVVVYERSSGGDPVVLSAEPRDWPGGEEIEEPYGGSGEGGT